MLRRIESVPGIDVEGVSRTIERLRSTARMLADLAGSDAERSRQRADLLEQALQFHEKQHDEQPRTSTSQSTRPPRGRRADGAPTGSLKSCQIRPARGKIRTRKG